MMKKVFVFLLGVFISMQAISQCACTCSCLPFSNDALVYLDGTVVDSAGNYYLQDKSGKRRNFLITGYDFSYLPNNYKGFPYKSLATISAPAGDATLIAADVNNYLYNSSGTPNAIPVTALFQDINYAHKIFSRHLVQVVDSTSKEVLEPMVADFVVYNTVKSGTDLSKCLEYFRVPTELSDTDAAWLSPTGNDATGAGTKASPWRSLSKIITTTKSTVYLMSGNYDPASSITFSGATALRIQGLGACTFRTWTTATGMTLNREITFANLEIRDSSSTNGLVITANTTLDRVRIDKKRGSYFAYGNSAGKTITLNNCIVTSSFVGTSLVRNNTALGGVTLTGNYGKILVAFNSANTITTATVKYNKGLSGSACTMYTAAFNYKDNKSLGTTIITALASRVVLENETVNFPISFSDSTLISNCSFTANLSGKFDSILNSSFIYGVTNITAKKDLLIRGNTFYGGVDSVTLYVRSVANSNITGVIVDSNIISGDRNSSYLFYIGETAAEAGVNAINGARISRNYVVNRRTGTSTGTCHTIIACGGINYDIYNNYVKMNNGYGIVVKAGGYHYTVTDPNIYYNVFENTGNCSYAMLVKGAFGVTAANNTVSNFSNLDVFSVNDDGSGLDNSFLVINNLVSLAGNCGNFASGTNMTSRNNYLNRNGYSCTLGGSDFTTSIVVAANGVPASRVNGGEITAKTVGLATTYSIPTNVTTQSQDATWQVGAIIY